MSKTVLAIPSELPGGMDAGMGMHFGHCAIYSIVEIENGEVTGQSTLAAVPHQQGGCLAPVQYLAGHGVTALLAGGMGMRPLAGFNQMNIEVFFAGNCATVGQAVEAFAQNKLNRFSLEQTCGGCEH